MDIHGRKELYIEYDSDRCAHYIKDEKKWINGGYDLMDARVGYDVSEPKGSPYRYGNGSCMHEITPITKEEAEAIAGSSIDPVEIRSKVFRK